MLHIFSLVLMALGIGLLLPSSFIKPEPSSFIKPEAVIEKYKIYGFIFLFVGLFFNLLSLAVS